LSVVYLLLHPTHLRHRPRDGHPVTIAPNGDKTGQTDADALQAALSDAKPGTVIQLASGTY